MEHKVAHQKKTEQTILDKYLKLTQKPFIFIFRLYLQILSTSSLAKYLPYIMR